MGTEQFEANSVSTVTPGDQLFAEALKEFSAMSYDAMIVCDNASVVIHANSIARSMLRTSQRAIIGRHLADVVPNYSNSVIEANVRQTIEANEVTSAELPNPVKEHSWIQFRSYPWHSVNLLVFRDITEHVRAHRFADVKAAMLDAMDLHGEIYYVRLDSAGFINRADKPFCDLLGIAEQRMIGANFADLASPSSKAELRELVRAVLSREDKAAFESEFVDNGGATHRLRGGLVALHGGYVLEGAIAMMTATT